MLEADARRYRPVFVQLENVLRESGEVVAGEFVGRLVRFRTEERKVRIVLIIRIPLFPVR